MSASARTLLADDEKRQPAQGMPPVPGFAFLLVNHVAGQPAKTSFNSGLTPAISADGSFVAYRSANGGMFRYDRQHDTTQTIFPDGFAKKVPAGYELMVNIHYIPIGRELIDHSQIGLYFSKNKNPTEIFTDSARLMDFSAHAIVFGKMRIL